MNSISPRSYTALAMLCGCALLYASTMARSSVTPIDIAVIVFLCAALLWNLFQLGRRLARPGQLRDVWHLVRTVGFWVIGLLDTWGRLDRPASWQQIIAWAILVIAAIDTFLIARKEARVVQGLPQSSTAEADLPRNG